MQPGTTAVQACYLAQTVPLVHLITPPLALSSHRIASKREGRNSPVLFFPSRLFSHEHERD